MIPRGVRWARHSYTLRAVAGGIVPLDATLRSRPASRETLAVGFSCGRHSPLIYGKNGPKATGILRLCTLWKPR